jgi:hypothetical protein
MSTIDKQVNALGNGQNVSPEESIKETMKPRRLSLSRRSFLGKSLAIGAGSIGASMIAANRVASAPDDVVTPGDAAILRFLSALETLETDLWQQYNELGGIQDPEVPGGTGNPTYTNALKMLDGDMDQYIHDNTENEKTHFTFINAYLVSKNMQPVNLDQFRTLPSSTATGAQQIPRLTNIMQLTVDTSWWTRYRSHTDNPDFGHVYRPAVPGLLQGEFPAIPRSDSDLTPPNHIQAIANTAGFHFATIEQGGTSLYPSLAQRVTNVNVLRILLSIGPSEAMHFQTWQDKAGNAPPLTDPTNGLVFPDLNSRPFGGELFQTNLIMPEPCPFFASLPPCAIVRPTNTRGAAMGALDFLTADGLFRGQTPAFFAFMRQLAQEADAAQRE